MDNEQNINGVEKTSVKYEDFVNKITKYMTKEMFENGKTKFTSYSNIYKNLDGDLAINAGGTSGYLVHVSNCKLQEKNSKEFKYSVTYKTYTYGENYSGDETKTVT